MTCVTRISQLNPNYPSCSQTFQPGYGRSLAPTSLNSLEKSIWWLLTTMYSQFPVISLLNDITSHTRCNHFTSVHTDHGLPATMSADLDLSASAKGSKQNLSKTASHCNVLSITPSSEQPNRKSNRNLQITLKEGTSREWMTLRCFIDKPNNSGLVTKSHQPVN